MENSTQNNQSQHQDKLSNQAIGTIVITIIVALITLGIAVWYVTIRNPVEANGSNTSAPENSKPDYSSGTSSDAYTMASRAEMKARDTERKTDIISLNNQAEVYFAKNGGYPALEDINDATWREANEFNTGTDDKALADPLYPQRTNLLKSTPKSITGGYSYSVSPAGCVSPTDSQGSARTVEAESLCHSFILTALLEDKEDKSALAVELGPGVNQYQYIKKYVSIGN